MSRVSQQDIWRALSSDTRRKILDLLHKRPMSTGDIADRFGELTRFAVMQHLGVLEEARLVLVRREGRKRINHLNAVPIQQIHERWVSKYAEKDAQALVSLKEHIEEGEDMDNEARSIRLESEIRLKASPERVWKAMTDEQTSWYPYNYGGERLKAIVTEPRVGGRVYEDWGKDAGHLYSTILHWDPPRSMRTVGYLSPAITLEQTTSLECDGDETVLKFSTTTFGPISEQMAEGIRKHGDMGLFEGHLRAWVERGERVSA